MTAVIVAVLAVVVIGGLLALERRKALREARKMSFKDSMNASMLAVVTFTVSGRKLNFLVDTGCNMNYIDVPLVEENKIEFKDLNRTVAYFRTDGEEESAPLVGIALHHGDRTFKDQFAVGDFSIAFGNIKDDMGIDVHGIIGTRFLEKYRYVLDFDDLKAYTK